MGEDGCFADLPVVDAAGLTDSAGAALFAHVACAVFIFADRRAAVDFACVSGNADNFSQSKSGADSHGLVSNALCLFYESNLISVVGLSVEEREVIIVGAGPAGATAATLLAQQGHDVLLLDRQTFPRDKACGDAVAAGSIALLQSLGMAPAIEKAVAAQQWYPVKSLRLVSPHGYQLEADFPANKIGYIAPRRHFDALLQQHAVACGAEFRCGPVQDLLLENNQVVGVITRERTGGQAIRAKVVIGADGATSLVARKLRTQALDEQHRAVALRAYVEGIELAPHCIEFYFFRDILPGGYAWLFPLGAERANIGLGLRLDRFRQRRAALDLAQALQRFIAHPLIKARLKPNSQVTNIATWPLTLGAQPHVRYAWAGALLIGDAAGFTNPLTGAGIHNALASAQLASEVIQQALQRHDLSYAMLRLYEQRCAAAFTAKLRRAHRLETLTTFPFIIDFLVRGLGKNGGFVQTFMAKIW